MKLFEATFNATAETADDRLFVKVAGRDGGEHGFGPVVWMPRGDLLPQNGDVALVAESSEGRWWAVAWAPRASLEG